MANLTRHSTVTLSYARALLDLSNRDQQAVPAGDELRDVRQILGDQPLFGVFFSDPAIGRNERAAVLEKALSSRVSPLLFKFLSVVNLHGRMAIVPQISEAYDDLLDDQLGKIEVDVTVAQALSPDQLEDVRRKVGASLGKEAVLYQHVDESIIGGMILHIQDRLIDGSVRSQLETLRNSMKLASA
jgi:F-type H+-transporting ATPase subunit delta